jgi:tetratricopeptide (TPR) repeat protein
VQRFASLAAMWYLASVVFYVKGRLKSQSAESKAQRGKKAMRYALGPMLYYSLSLVFAVLAMRTKETAFTLPLAIAAFEFIFFKTSRMKKILVPAVITVLVIISLGPAGLNKPFGEIWSDLDRNTRVQTDMPRWDYLMTELRVIVTYIRLIFFPVNQKLDYNYPVYNSLFDPPVLLSFLFLSTLFGTAVYLLYKTRRAKNSPPQPPLAKGGIEGGVCTMPYALCPLRLTAFGILWFFITLSVESSVIPIADVIFEHRVYLPSIGAFIAITASLFVAADKLKAGRPRAVAAFFLAQSLVVVGLSGLTYARNSVWQDDIRLIADAVSKNPGKASLYNGLGHAYLVKGFTDEAMGQFRIAMRLDPDYAQPHLNLGVAYGKKGMLDEAIGEFEAAMKLTPRNPEIYNNIAIIYRQRGQTAREITYLKISLEIDPYFAVSHYNIAAAYASLGWPDKAGEHFKIAHELDPDKY